MAYGALPRPTTSERRQLQFPSCRQRSRLPPPSGAGHPLPRSTEPNLDVSTRPAIQPTSVARAARQPAASTTTSWESNADTHAEPARTAHPCSIGQASPPAPGPWHQQSLHRPRFRDCGGRPPCGHAMSDCRTSGNRATADSLSRPTVGQPCPAANDELARWLPGHPRVPRR